MNAYARLPVSFVRGEGATLWDAEGREYLDVLGGIAVTFLGHCHPRISEAISLQANKLLHVSNLFHIQEQAALGEKVCQIANMDKVFFANSGTEANEAAIKIARLHGHSKKIDAPVIVTTHDSFHGRSYGALSATGNPKLHENLQPMLPGFVNVAYNDIEAIRACSEDGNVVAVMLEPIQGEAGIVIPDPGYLKEVRALCDQNDWLLILDEIQTGMGRTGKWFAFQHEEIVPDVVTIAKALGNGIPIGACAASGKAADLISPGSHGTTFGGNPFASQIGLTVINTIEEEGLIAAAESNGTLFKKQLQQKLGALPSVVAIRGKGLMLAVELDQAYPDLASRFLEAGLVINITGGGKVIRILPAAIMSETQIKTAAGIIHDIISAL